MADTTNKIYSKGNQLQLKIDEHTKDPEMPRYTIVINNVTGEGKICPGTRLIIRNSKDLKVSGESSGTSDSIINYIVQDNVTNIANISDLTSQASNQVNWNI